MYRNRRYRRYNREPNWKAIIILITIMLMVKWPLLIPLFLGVFLVKKYLAYKKQSNIEITEDTRTDEKNNSYLPYRKKEFLLTKAEYNFDKALREAVGDMYHIERQVPLSNIIETTTTYKPFRSKIDKKTLDFVLFTKAGYRTHLVIELDDTTHMRQDRVERDKFVEDVLQKTGIPIVRIKTSYNYNVSEIAELIK